MRPDVWCVCVYEPREGNLTPDVLSLIRMIRQSVCTVDRSDGQTTTVHVHACK